MKLYLVQHGEACAKDVDPARPLTLQGKADVNRLAVFLRKAGVKAERVMHSGKLRAEQTMQRLVNTVAPGVTPETSDMLDPNHDVGVFARHIREWNQDTLIVGHLPFMARLVSQLTLGNTLNLYAAYTPGSIVCLERTGDSQWAMNWMVHPEIIN